MASASMIYHCILKSCQQKPELNKALNTYAMVLTTHIVSANCAILTYGIVVADCATFSCNNDLLSCS